MSETLLVQRADNLIVLLDESTGAEVTFPVDHTEKVVRAMTYLATGNLEAAKAMRLPVQPGEGWCPQIGEHVEYRSHPESVPEPGVVQEVSGETAMVLYLGDRTAKSTRICDLRR